MSTTADGTTDESLEDRTADFMHALAARDDLPVSNISGDDSAPGSLMAVEFVLEDVHKRGNVQDLADEFGFAESEFDTEYERDWSRPGRVAHVPNEAKVKFVSQAGGL